MTEQLELIGKWNGKEYPIVVSPSDTIQDVKHRLEVIHSKVLVSFALGHSRKLGINKSAT